MSSIVHDFLKRDRWIYDKSRGLVMACKNPQLPDTDLRKYMVKLDTSGKEVAPDNLSDDDEGETPKVTAPNKPVAKKCPKAPAKKKAAAKPPPKKKPKVTIQVVKLDESSVDSAPSFSESECDNIELPKRVTRKEKLAASETTLFTEQPYVNICAPSTVITPAPQRPSDIVVPSIPVLPETAMFMHPLPSATSPIHDLNSSFCFNTYFGVLHDSILQTAKIKELERREAARQEQDSRQFFQNAMLQALNSSKRL